jgi:ribonuclease BN (tRNA processing enzyme)
MKITLHGVRGSIPTTGAETSYFGGNTSCVTVLEDDCFLVLDGGSGMQKVRPPASANQRIDILLTHLHLDHIQGLGFFSPLFDPDREVHIWAPASATQSLHARLSRYLSPPLFPVLIRDLPCRLTLHDIENSHFDIGPFKVESRYIIHPGPTVGFRITGQTGVMSFLPDHEPALGTDKVLDEPKWISGYDLFVDADLLIHDAQYTPEEYSKRVGWGHSTMEDAIHLARVAGVKRLLLTHHDPGHTDEHLRELFSRLQASAKSSLVFEMAREGMEIEL